MPTSAMPPPAPQPWGPVPGYGTPTKPPAPGTAAPGTAPGTARRVRSTILTIALVGLSFMSSLVAAAFASQAQPDSGLHMAWTTAAMVLAAGVASLVLVRDRYPVLLAVVGSLFALLMPVDSVAALIGLSVVVATRPRRQAVLVGALVSVATAAAVLRDAFRPAEHQVFVTKVADGVPVDDVVGLPWWFYLGVFLVSLSVSVGIGLLGRTRADLSTVRAEAARGEQTQQELRTELTRQEERDLIAREVHDTLAYRLSLVSLQAGVLEIAASGSEALKVAANDIQENAHQSLTDLRGLIGVLRDPSSVRTQTAPDLPGTLSLGDLAELLAASRKAGNQMVATVMVNDSESASATLAHATYRIVQESLTNIHKHAPESAIDLRLTASAASGVRIIIVNRLGSSTPGHIPGAGAGVTGIRERVRVLGGQATIGEREGQFVVDVWLPWLGGENPAAQPLR